MFQRLNIPYQDIAISYQMSNFLSQELENLENLFEPDDIIKIRIVLAEIIDILSRSKNDIAAYARVMKYLDSLPVQEKTDESLQLELGESKGFLNSNDVAYLQRIRHMLVDRYRDKVDKFHHRWDFSFPQNEDGEIMTQLIGEIQEFMNKKKGEKSSYVDFKRDHMIDSETYRGGGDSEVDVKIAKLCNQLDDNNSKLFEAWIKMKGGQQINTLPKAMLNEGYFGKKMEIGKACGEVYDWIIKDNKITLVFIMNIHTISDPNNGDMYFKRQDCNLIRKCNLDNSDDENFINAVGYFPNGADLFLMSSNDGDVNLSDEHKLFLYQDNAGYFYRIKDSECKQYLNDERVIEVLNQEIFDQPSDYPNKCQNKRVCRAVLEITSAEGHSHPPYTPLLQIGAEVILDVQKNAENEDVIIPKLVKCDVHCNASLTESGEWFLQSTENNANMMSQLGLQVTRDSTSDFLGHVQNYRRDLIDSDNKEDLLFTLFRYVDSRMVTSDEKIKILKDALNPHDKLGELFWAQRGPLQIVSCEDSDSLTKIKERLDLEMIKKHDKHEEVMNKNARFI